MPPSRSLTSQQPAALLESQKDFAPIDAKHNAEAKAVLTSASPKSIGEIEIPSPFLRHMLDLLHINPGLILKPALRSWSFLSYDAKDGEQEWTPVVGKRKKCGHVALFIRDFQETITKSTKRILIR